MHHAIIFECANTDCSRTLVVLVPENETAYKYAAFVGTLNGWSKPYEDRNEWLCNE